MNHLLVPGLFVMLSALLLGCDSVDSNEIDDLVVVEAFLFAGEPVTNIRLAEAIPLASEDSVAVPISDAAVYLVKEDVRYPLAPSDSAGYYHYPDTDLSVEAGDVFRLEVAYEGTSIAAETVVPPAPTGVTLSSQTLEVATFGGPGSGGGPPQVQNNALTVTWDNPSATLHYVVIESLVTGEPEYILPEFIRERFAGFRLITSPTDAHFFDVNARALEVFGPHRAVVYRVNQEYADLYENREQDSRDLNEPPTNVEGGLGVFSAFNSDVAAFEVVPADG